MSDIDWKRLGWTVEEMERLITRREHIERNVPQCPCCAADQAQIMDHHEPAVWRCRECKHRFTFEP